MLTYRDCISVAAVIIADSNMNVICNNIFLEQLKEFFLDLVEIAYFKSAKYFINRLSTQM